MKPSGNGLRNIGSKICTGVLLCASTSVHAQTTSRPDVTTQSWRTVIVSALDIATALAGNSAISSTAAGTIDAREAARRLEKTRLERLRGVDPLPGEQDRRAGSNAMKYRYWQRQERLRLAVELAQRRALMAQRHDVSYGVYASALPSSPTALLRPARGL